MNGVFWLMRCGVVESFDRKKVSKKLKKGLLKYKKKDEQFSMILKEIIDEMEYNDTVKIKCIGEVQVVLDTEHTLGIVRKKFGLLLLKVKMQYDLMKSFFQMKKKVIETRKKL